MSGFADTVSLAIVNSRGFRSLPSLFGLVRLGEYERAADILFLSHSHCWKWASCSFPIVIRSLLLSRRLRRSWIEPNFVAFCPYTFLYVYCEPLSERLNTFQSAQLTTIPFPSLFWRHWGTRLQRDQTRQLFKD